MSLINNFYIPSKHHHKLIKHEPGQAYNCSNRYLIYFQSIDEKQNASRDKLVNKDHLPWFVFILVLNYIFNASLMEVIRQLVL